MQHDLTRGSIPGHLAGMAAFIGLGMLFQTLYYLVDLYFVAAAGPAALAGVGLAGVVLFFVMALGQVIGVGSICLISRALGGGDADGVVNVFSQSMLLSVGLALLILAAGYGFGGAAVRAVAADPETARQGTAYLYGSLPALALMSVTGALGAALRAAGVVRPTMLVQAGSVALNAALAPVLIVGWLTDRPLGAFGAGLATSVSAGAGLVAALWLFGRVQTLLADPLRLRRPEPAVIRRIVGIGLPSAAEFILTFLTLSITYALVRGFGDAAQAGFGVGSRVMQAIFLPVMAIAFAVVPVAGQNLGAGLPDRVRETIRTAVLASTGLMLILTLICHLQADWLVAPFARDTAVAAVATTYLGIVSLNFVATGLIVTASGAFQALGDTRPALIGGGLRLAVFVTIAVWLVHQPWATLKHLWWASAGAAFLHAAVALLLLWGQLGVRLQPRGR